jgi:hypothetical protein
MAVNLTAFYWARGAARDDPGSRIITGSPPAMAAYGRNALLDLRRLTSSASRSRAAPHGWPHAVALPMEDADGH